MRDVMDAGDIARAQIRIAHEILERNRGSADLVVVGIHTRGAPLAERIAAAIGEIDQIVPLGTLDIGLYRDDIGKRKATPLGPTNIPVSIDDKTVVIVDDVLFTGRTIRAALDALADLGRPNKVELAVLVDRGHRQLPIRADYVGKNLPTRSDQRVSVKLEEIDGVDVVQLHDGDR